MISGGFVPNSFGLPSFKALAQQSKAKEHQQLSQHLVEPEIRTIIVRTTPRPRPRPRQRPATAAPATPPTARSVVINHFVEQATQAPTAASPTPTPAPAGLSFSSTFRSMFREPDPTSAPLSLSSHNPFIPEQPTTPVLPPPVSFSSFVDHMTTPRPAMPFLPFLDTFSEAPPEPDPFLPVVSVFAEKLRETGGNRQRAASLLLGRQATQTRNVIVDGFPTGLPAGTPEGVKIALASTKDRK